MRILIASVLALSFLAARLEATPRLHAVGPGQRTGRSYERRNRGADYREPDPRRRSGPVSHAEAIVVFDAEEKRRRRQARNLAAVRVSGMVAA